MATSLSAPLQRPLAQASAWLTGLSARERRLVMLAAAVFLLGLLWWVAVAPALQTLRQAPARHAALDAQLTHMQQLARTAEGLRAATAGAQPGRDEALRALDAATAALGATGQVSVLGDRATLTLRGAPPQALAQWLAQVRINARLLPVESKLARDGGTGGWSGTVVLGGPALAAN